jgi:hypothetical protein
MGRGSIFDAAGATFGRLLGICPRPDGPSNLDPARLLEVFDHSANRVGARCDVLGRAFRQPIERIELGRRDWA